MRESVEFRELKARWGAYLRQVQDGTTLVVTKQGQPIAEVRPPGLVENRDAIEEEVGALGLASYQCQMPQTDSDLSALRKTDNMDLPPSGDQNLKDLKIRAKPKRRRKAEAPTPLKERGKRRVPSRKKPSSQLSEDLLKA